MQAIVPRLVSWFTLLVTPAGTPMDEQHMLVARVRMRTVQTSKDKQRQRKKEKQVPMPSVVGGPDQALSPE